MISSPLIARCQSSIAFSSASSYLPFAKLSPPSGLLRLGLTHPHTLQCRTFIANLTPKNTRFRKAFKGFFKSKSGGSLRGTTVRFGEYGLQMVEGGRLSDKQLDVARANAKRALKGDKTAKLYLRCFTDRPVTSKGSESRMGKGKGVVDYYATWVPKDKVIFEVKGARKESAQRALQIAAAGLPLRSKFVVGVEGEGRKAPRCLPYFVQQKLKEEAAQKLLEKRRLAATPVTA